MPPAVAARIPAPLASLAHLPLIPAAVAFGRIDVTNRRVTFAVIIIPRRARRSGGRCAAVETLVILQH